MTEDDKLAQLKEVLGTRFGEVLEFRHSLSEETDRGCALMAASYLDAELEQVLIDRFVDNSSVVVDLVQPSRPIGSFSARIDLAYLMGLVGAISRRDLHLIRKVRNDFGHNAQAITFDEPSIADRCRELQLTYLDPAAEPRRRFTSSVLGVAAHLHAARFRAQHIPQAEERVPKDWTEEQIMAFAESVLQDVLGTDSDA